MSGCASGGSSHIDRMTTGTTDKAADAAKKILDKAGAAVDTLRDKAKDAARVAGAKVAAAGKKVAAAGEKVADAGDQAKP
jgi:hypothetical protein